MHVNVSFVVDEQDNVKIDNNNEIRNKDFGILKTFYLQYFIDNKLNLFFQLVIDPRKQKLKSNRGFNSFNFY